MKKALFANGPCYGAFPVYNPEKMELWKQEYPTQEVLGGHALTIVGWLKDAFIIRNSWSATWGDQGYTYYPFNQWGMHWECWTCVDAKSNPETLAKKAEDHMKSLDVKKGFFKKLFNK